MKDAAPRVAAAYIRVSTEEQTEQSPESQLVEIRKYAAAHNLILPGDLIYMDEGISGKRSENRPAFQRMIGAAKEKPAPFQVILLWKFSRFARNQEESIVYKALLRKQCGVDVVSVSEQLPDGPFASLIERIIEWFDEFYSIRLAQEVKRSMTVKAQKGDWQSKPPYGYRIDRTDGKKGVLKVVPEEAAIVREVFERFVGGEGSFSISKSLCAQGITTKNGIPFTNARIQYMIYNPVYIGKVRWTPTGRNHSGRPTPDAIVVDGTHEPIISPELYQAAQEKMARTKAAWGYKARPTYELKDWLSGIVRCSACGATLIAYKKQYFKCGNYCHGRCVHTQLVKIDVLHAAIISKLQEDLNTGGLDYTITRSASNSRNETARLQTQLADLNRRDSRLLDAYLGGAIPLEQYADAKKVLAKSIAEVEAQIAEAEAKDTAVNGPDLLVENIGRTLRLIESPDASLEAKNTALRQIIERINFDRDSGTLDITYRLFF